MVHAFVASAIVASPLIAQKQDKAAAQGATCSIKTDKPDEVKSAMNAVTIAQLGGRPEDVQKKLKGAVTSLTTNPGKFKDNQAGHDYVLAQTLLRLAAQYPDSATVDKSTIGYADGKGPIDLLTAADSLLTNVEKASPDCDADIGSLRREAMRPFAVRLSTVTNTDSISVQETLLKRLVTIDSKSPLSLYFQGVVAQNKKDPSAAADFFSRGAMLMPAEVGPDSNLKAALELGAAQMTRIAASGKNGDEKKAGMLKSAELYKKFLADFPKNSNVSAAQAGLSAALSASGDVQSISPFWDQMLANPGAYTDGQLYDAGTQAFTMNQLPTAVKLMMAAQKSNPWYRAGLYNAANVYWKAGDIDRMLATSKTLTTLDPNNPDNFQLVALAYQAKAKATKDLKIQKAYNDSLNVALTTRERIKTRVNVESFLRGDKAELKGAIENADTVAARKGTLRLQFLNVSGTTVSTQDVPFDLPPRSKMPFALTGSDASIVGYKYDAIP